MSDFLGRLAQRVVAPQTLLQPRLPSLFEAAAAPAEPMPPETIETAALPTMRAAAVPPPRATVPSAPVQPAPDTHPSERLPPAERTAAEKRRENAMPPAPPAQREQAITPEVLERIPIEIAADATLGPPAADAAAPDAAPHQLTTPPTPPAARIVTRRAIERRQPHRVAPLEANENESAPPAERDVHITIGRIDVRAVTPPARERPAAKPPRTLTLDEYLAQRSRR